MPTPASVADSPRSAAARAAREQPVGTPRRGRERALLLFAARPSGPARGNAWSPSSGHACEAVGGSGRGKGCADARGLSGPDVGSAWAERPSSVSICRSWSPRKGRPWRAATRCSSERQRRSPQARPITSAAASSRRFGSRGSAGRRFWVSSAAAQIFGAVDASGSTSSAACWPRRPRLTPLGCGLAFGRQLDRARRGGREYESDRRWMRAFRAKRARRRAAGQKPRSPIAGLCRPRVPWRLAEERTGIRVAAWPTNAASRYSVPLCVASSLGERSAGAGTRRSSWSINAPQRSGSSRKGAWRPGMTSRRASGRSAHARWPISGPP